VLRRAYPTRPAAQFYSLIIERDLFGQIRPVRNWGQVGPKGREIVEEYGSELEAGQALEAVAEDLRRRGYQDL
jgi:predicted DNA-binding WGR domain protein